MRLILTLLLAATATNTLAAPDPVRLAKCQYGVLIAQKAYLTGTLDTHRPNLDHLEYLVDYWADDFEVQVDREVAKRAVNYMAATLIASSARRPHAGLLYEPIRHILVDECSQYMEIRQ